MSLQETEVLKEEWEMSKKKWLSLAVAALLGGAATAQAQTLSGDTDTPVKDESAIRSSDALPGPGRALRQDNHSGSAAAWCRPSRTPASPGTPGKGEPAPGQPAEGRPPRLPPRKRPSRRPKSPLGPTPLTKVNILNDLIFGDNTDKAMIKVSGWSDFDYTYRSTGHGQNNVAPVMNRFGDEFLNRQIGLYISKPLDPKELSWGFNVHLHRRRGRLLPHPHRRRLEEHQPPLRRRLHRPEPDRPPADPHRGRRGHQGRPADDRPRTDGRPALAARLRFQRLRLVQHGRRPLHRRVRELERSASSWTGTTASSSAGARSSTTIGPAPQYITQISYWLDEEAKKTKVWTTVLTGPTGKFSTGNTTVVELGILHNYNKYCVPDRGLADRLLEGADLRSRSRRATRNGPTTCTRTSAAT